MIEIQTPEGKTEQISYDVLAICTGANYCSPWRAKHDTLDTAVNR
jgi:hypothetical protein